MINKVHAGLLGLIFVVVSCTIDKEERPYSSFFVGKSVGKKHITIKNLSLDTLTLTGMNTSYVGLSAIADDTLYIIDKLFCWVYVLDKDGKLIDKKLGQGPGPSELNLKNIDSFCFLKDGRKLFVGSSLDLHIYDLEWKRIVKKVIEWEGDYSYNDIYSIDSPSPTEISLYGFEYEKFKMLNSSLEPNVVFAPIYSEHPEFNAFVSKNYYTQGRIIARLDIDKAKVTGLLGRRSPVYLEKKFIGQHSFFSFTLGQNDDFYISHEVDSMIYHYDSDFNLIEKFGYSGKNMNTSYSVLHQFDMEKIRSLYFEDRPKKGYYEEVFYNPSEKILLRSYRRGNNSTTNGLQIYSGNTLVGDVDVPNDFVIMGYIAPYYYSMAVFDDTNEKITVYRFRL